MNGFVSEIERCSTVDGPGIRTIVFLKGCPLRCRWCHNPENLWKAQQVGWVENKCIGCLRCVQACPKGLIRQTSKALVTDETACTGCARCAAVCPTGARVVFGRQMTAEEVAAEVARDALFFQTSRGGVTVSGGEPLFQPEFTAELLRLCHEKGFHTALDTCGFAPTQALEAVLPYVDLALFDLKHADPEAHRQVTGQRPESIWDNLRRIDEKGISIWIRTPIVPGLNDSEENVIALARIVNRFPRIARWELMPFHRFGEEKYRQLQMAYPSEAIQPPSRADMERLADTARQHCEKPVRIQ